MDLGSLLRFASAYLLARWAMKASPLGLKWLRNRRWRALKSRVIPRASLYRGLGHLPSNAGDWNVATPVFDKKQVMDDFSGWNTLGITEAQALAWGQQGEATRNFGLMPRGISVGLSSGTSGRRGVFLTTESERIRWAAVVMARYAPGFWKTPQRVALFLRANSPLYETLGSSRVTFRYFDLLRPLPDLARELSTFDPTVLFGPPSVLEGLCRCLDDQGGPIKPRMVVCGAEVLEPSTKAFLEQRFQVSVREIYQATEGFLAFTCESGRLHWNEDYFVVEKQFLPSEGAVRYIPILTDLVRSSQPLVRYRLNDVLTADPRPCPCGCRFEVIARIEGREDDILCLDAPGGLVPVYPDFVRRAVSEADPVVEHFRVVQTAPGHLTVYWTSTDEKRLRELLHQLWRQVGASPPNLEFQPYQAPAPGQKLRRVERSFALPDDFWKQLPASQER